MLEGEARSHIEEIQRSYIVGETRILEALTGAMQIIEKTFTRSGHFVLEFIQNAEDAGARRVKIVLESGAIKIFNDGKPFTRDDVEAICSIGRSRKDPRKHIGYLGVGFKAVFLVSSRPHIYSKTYRFKFDKQYWEGKHKNVPWQITPIWLDEVPEELRDWNVYFYIPIDERSYEEKIRDELESLTPTTLLFLHSIDELELVFDGKNKVFRREKKEENENYTIYTLKEVENGVEKESNWVVFRRVVKVPDEIRADKYTKDWDRDRVEYREVAVAFKLDSNGDLEPVPGTVKFGVFSYVPLKGEPIELPYYIHADFLLVAGREVIHREAKWNRWILGEIAKLIVEHVIKVFKSHEKWRYSYVNVLYTKTRKEPFAECLVNPIIREIERGPHFATVDGGFARLSEIVKVEQRVLDALAPKGTIEKLKIIVEKIANKKIVDPRVRLPSELTRELRKSNRLIVIEDVKDLREIAKGLGRYRKDLEDVRDLVIKLLEPFELVKRLKDPSISDQERVEIVKRLKELWKNKEVGAEDLIKGGFVIRTKSGKWIEPQKALLQSEYEPRKSVERLVKAGLLDPGLVEFVDPVFIEGATEDEIKEWRDFLQNLKVGTDESVIRKLVENIGIRVALKYEREVLGIKDARPLSESERDRGYDIESRMPDGSPKYIEVKASRSEEPAIELTGNEYRHVSDNPERSFVYVVANVFSNPTLYVVPGDTLDLEKFTPARITICWSDLSSKVKEKWKPPI